MDRVSAFMDGETKRREARQVIRGLKQDTLFYETWDTFHLIGDVMRGDSLLRSDFPTRMRRLLQQEPTVVARRFDWHRMTDFPSFAAAVVALAALAVVLALALTDNPLRPHPQLAAVPESETAPVLTTAAQPVPAANQGRINGYLMAHQEFSPSTALQGVAPYVRAVSAPYENIGR